MGRLAFFLPAALLLSPLLWPRGASGHPQYTLSTINRYAKLVIDAPQATGLKGAAQLRLTYVLMVGDVPALPLRRQADRDQNGRISADEAAALGRELGGRVKAGLRLQLDGAPVPVAFAEPVVGLAGDEVAPSAFSVDLQAVIPLDKGAPGAEHGLLLDDGAVLPPVGELEYVIEESPGVILRASQRGREPAAGGAGVTTRFRYLGPPQSSLTDRSIQVRFALPPPPRPPLGRIAAAIGGLLVLLLAIGALVWRRGASLLTARCRTSPACSTARSS